MADIKDRVKRVAETGADNSKNLTDQTLGAALDAVNDLGIGDTRAQHQSGAFMDSMRDNAQSALHSAEEFAVHARDRIGEYAGRVGEKAQTLAKDAADVAGHYAKDFRQEVTGVIRRYPIQALLVGFGVGVLLGRAVRT